VGAQLGFVNLARDVRGVQMGMLNVAAERVRGLQLGVVNYADEADFSLALLGITRKGGAHLQLTVSEVMLPEVALRLEATYNYSFVSIGVSPYRGELHRAYTIGAGLGAKLPLWLEQLWLDIDVGVHVVQPMLDWYRGLPNTLWQLRILPRYQLHEHFGVFAGLTVNALLQVTREERITPGVLRRRNAARDEEARVLIWPGFALGARL
jgi:hypothetical protein